LRRPLGGRPRRGSAPSPRAASAYRGTHRRRPAGPRARSGASRRGKENRAGGGMPLAHAADDLEPFGALARRGHLPENESATNRSLTRRALLPGRRRLPPVSRCCRSPRGAFPASPSPPPPAAASNTCRYLPPPALALYRLAQTSGGQLLYELGRPRADGSTHLLLEPLELLDRLAALVPAPRTHLRHVPRGPRPAAWRSLVVPQAAGADGQSPTPGLAPNTGPSSHRLSRAALLRRVWRHVTRPLAAESWWRRLRWQGFHPREPRAPSPASASLSA
jgi:hypothetical protein